MTGAVVFDFDGTILDTETPVYEGWAAAFEHAGATPVALDVWLQHIGQSEGNGFDMRQQLCDQLGIDSFPAEIEAFMRRSITEMVIEQPIRPGVIDWITAAESAGIAMAVASSSPSTWVQPHLERLGLDQHFPVVSCADPGIPGKPDPTVYLSACAGLGVDPADAVAIEDSPTGVRAAIDAGMRCIAAPGPLTRGLNFDRATVQVDDLAQLNHHDWL